MPDSKENQGSYSMYPPSPVPPAAQIPPGAAAAAANSYIYTNPYHSQYNYGYPLGIEIYPSQTMQYMGYHQPAMAYGSYGGPAQGAVPMKKKFYSNNTNYKKDNQSNGNVGAGSMMLNGVNHSNGNNNVANMDSNKPVQVTIKNLFKFELGNSNSVRIDGLKIEYPMYVNTTAEEFAKAKVKRHILRLEALKDLESKKDVPVSKKDSDQKDRKSNSEQKFREAASTEDDKVESKRHTEHAEIRDSKNEEQSIRKDRHDAEVSNSSNRDPSPKKDEYKQSQNLGKKKEDSESNSFTASTNVKSEDKRGDAPVKTLKPWSQIASSAVSKTKPISITTSTLSKREKKYVPSNIKGSEPVGAVALRMSFDRDYKKYVNDTAPETTKAINTIVPRGILNKGNICFMSSVLQVLLFCKPFISMLNAVCTRTGTKSSCSLPPLLDACLDFYKEFDKGNFEKERGEKQSISGNNGKASKGVTRLPLADVIDPESFYKSISKLSMFRELQWGHQEDAEEFLTHFLDQLHEEFVSAINTLSSNEIMNLLQSISDDELKTEFIRSLPKYKSSDFVRKMSAELKTLIENYGSNPESESNSNGDEDICEWHEVSKKGKRAKNAVKRTMEVEPSPIMSIFGGEYRSVLDIPQNKESQSITLDPFYTLHLHISDPEVNDLESAFKKFSDFEYLPYKADSGNDVEAKKQAFIDRLPQVLLIQLKRFEFVNNNSERRELVNYNAYNGRIEKICKWIKYDHDLTIPKEALSSINAKFLFSDNDTSYKLTGVVYHHGLSSSGGHYTADVLHQDEEKWYRIDDTTVTEINKEEVVTGGEEGSHSRTAYILIYQRA
ncbi:mRNA-binding ubiquitin-specific protease UBP3 Ecym_5544 [Eremothecium cymbalariae DBVPG|uniref:Ubiquitin carboxyl-terminal hydrolase n=1 Tax=Eremothecium cymbalariae (strain CBS 270.75 / DBVPG 7215 / KCTC 17166 / NRRL Y-17582) TaxID=931890 RepID=I6NDZ2_ERECY|nr:hypothetical protein Ecym_5544 [Eremothecium cymbalariae DBVPG\